MMVNNEVGCRGVDKRGVGRREAGCIGVSRRGIAQRGVSYRVVDSSIVDCTKRSVVCSRDCKRGVNCRCVDCRRVGKRGGWLQMFLLENNWLQQRGVR